MEKRKGLNTMLNHNVIAALLYTCAIIFEKDLNSGLAGMRSGVPTSTSVPEDPSEANRSEKNTLRKEK